MNIRALVIGSVFLAAGAPALAAGTHCSQAEETVFSCNLGHKVVSVCASQEVTQHSGYIQYRFGALGRKPELSFPKTTVKPGKVIQARTLMFAGGGGDYLRFNSGKTSYIVYSAIGKGWGTKDGVAVERHGKLATHLECQDVPTSKMGRFFFDQAGLREDAREFELP